MKTDAPNHMDTKAQTVTARERLQMQGWTPEIIRERLVGIRDNARAFRAMKGSAQYSYRLLNVCQYLRHRSMLAILSE